MTYLDSEFASHRVADLELPHSGLLALLLPQLSGTEASLGCSYSLVDGTHAIQHACYLLKILHEAALQMNKLGQQIVYPNECSPWLIDSLVALSQEQKRWQTQCDYDPSVFLEMALEMSRSASDLEVVLLQKLDATMVLFAADLAEHLNEAKFNRDDAHVASKTLSFALVHLADASTQNKPVSKLVAAQLLKVIDALRTENKISDNDLEVGFCLCLEQMMWHRLIP